MIDKALSFIVNELNVSLGTRFENSGPHAVLSSLTNQDGSAPLVTENKLVLSLVNIERETSADRALHLNLYLQVSSNFATDYLESLHFLSAALEFFLERPVFGVPALPSGIKSLSVEMVNLTTQDLQNLWSISGSQYLPSALYKLRMSTTPQGLVP
jgi:hypothetical protein